MVPGVTLALIGLNFAVFLWQTRGGDDLMQIKTLRYASVPANVLMKEPVVWAMLKVSERSLFGWMSGESETMPVPARLSEEERIAYLSKKLRRLGQRARDVVFIEPALPAWQTLLTSMFMHGGWMHLLGNLVFLWVFGARLEERLRPFRFLLFYLLTGVAAALSHVISDPDSAIPMVGASGAISGLLGGFVLTWPQARILALIPIFGWMTLQEIPALVFVVFWVAMQVFLILGPSAAGGGGVAVWAHLGGFIYGLLLIRFFDKSRRASPPTLEFPRGAGRPDRRFDESIFR